MHAICVQIFRHIAQKSLARHQVCLRNFCAICRKIRLRILRTSFIQCFLKKAAQTGRQNPTNKERTKRNATVCHYFAAVGKTGETPTKRERSRRKPSRILNLFRFLCKFSFIVARRRATFALCGAIYGRTFQILLLIVAPERGDVTK